jgi:3-(3-hydroxy-phenyl)propionate hydroxylase
VPGLRAKILDSETPPLRRTALVERPRWRRSPAGRLCPNAALSDGRRFDEGVGNRFAVVSAVDLQASQRDTLAGLGVVVVEAPAGTALHDWLATHHVTAALVRPDRTVMAAGPDVARICASAPAFPVAAG